MFESIATILVCLAAVTAALAGQLAEPPNFVMFVAYYASQCPKSLIHIYISKSVRTNGSGCPAGTATFTPPNGQFLIS